VLLLTLSLQSAAAPAPTAQDLEACRALLRTPAGDNDAALALPLHIAVWNS